MYSEENMPVPSEVDRDQPPFTLPQFGIFAQGTHAHHFLEFDLKPGVTPAQAVSAFRQLRTPDVSAGGVNLVLAFGARLWQAVAPDMSPPDLASFQPLIGKDGRGAPATQHDAWLWISGAAPDVTWHSARAALMAFNRLSVQEQERVFGRTKEDSQELPAADGVRDRLTDFSRPVSGAYYFAPSLNALNELAGEE
jgi:deferrochelatase/peroxidase EfeB